MFKTKQRIQSAWAKGLMFGKAVGARDERDRIIYLLEAHSLDTLGDKDNVWQNGFTTAIALIKGVKDD